MIDKASSPPVVLVVDDEALLRMHAADVLEEEGYHVVEASDAAEAIRVMESRTDVRLVFTDIQMPGPLDGIDLAHEVHKRWPKVLLVVTSGRIAPAPEDLPDEGRFVAKPYQPKALLEEVNNLVKKSGS